jgi:diguanylate cyclase (GGDEF)-like protein
MKIKSMLSATIENVVDVLGLRLKDPSDIDARLRHVRATSTIAVSVGFVFSLFNIFTPGMLALGLTELAAVVFLLIPSMLIIRNPARIAACENLILAAAVVILGALMVFGGVGGTGLFWVYLAPFLAFFLKGQRRGWWCSISFIGLAVLYFSVAKPLIPFAYAFPVDVQRLFLISLVFYTVLAAAFNQLRSRFEELLQQRVEERTASAKALLSEKQFLATHDSTTNLPNRVMLASLIAEEIAEVQNTGQYLVVCNLRLERFFEMGNVLGQAGIDNLVRAVATHLGDSKNGHRLLARTRRDEFVMVYRTRRAAVSAKFLKQFIADRQFSVEEEGNIFLIEFTLGFAIYPAHAPDAQALLTKAEQAMLQAQKNGLQWTAYDEKQEQLFVRHHTLFGKLKEALHKGHLHVYYQPQIDLATGRVLGAEALTRWIDPVEGMISPLDFIPVAEQSGLIRPLTTWLVGQCLRESARWTQHGLHLDVSINLSARNLMDPNLLGTLQRALDKSKIPPSTINMEITESCFMAQPERALEVIQKIHEMGFKLSIDDFGTGYSSLAYLKNLPIDELKIDQSFVRQLLDNPGDQAIVSSTIDLAHNLKLSVVAEGIEDEASAIWLREHGCDVGQGYFYARPMPADDFLAFAIAQGAA